ncbi:MAG: hypothetical protein JRJ65_17575 [Deltaproteobacteria bacterium]|nr:hypothetical protein [Deltaproteobacteria bacterium]
MENKQKSLWLKVRMSLFVGVFTVFTGLGLFQFASSQAVAGGRCGLCTQTSYAAFRACKNETRDDYWIAIGNCNNLSDPDERAECKREAWGELRSARGDCRDQFDARQDICDELGQGPYDPVINPDDFVDPDDIGGDVVAANLYTPLIPGTVWVYEGETEEGTETITVTVTGETKEIEYPEESGLIFTCRVVRDVVKLDGEVIEDTDDWYAQDTGGNVWYFGEISQEFEDGELVGIEGSWKSGVDGAKPGIIMKADPQEGDYYRQEFFLGDAEDMGEVVSRDVESVTVPFGTYENDVLKTKDFTPIEPDVLEYKFYAPGVGMVLEENPEDDERVELINMTTP